MGRSEVVVDLAVVDLAAEATAEDLEEAVGLAVAVGLAEAEALSNGLQFEGECQFRAAAVPLKFPGNQTPRT